MRSVLRSLLLLLLVSPLAWADTGTATSTLTITPSATAGTTITASDENSRSNTESTWANAHVHSLSNTTNVGDGTAGNKSVCADAADTTDACIRWNDTANLWTLDNPVVGTFNEIATMSGTAGLTANAVVFGDGTGALRTVTHGASGTSLVSQGSGAAPIWQTTTSASTTSGRVHRTAGDVATTSTSLVDFTGASLTLTTGTNPVLMGFAGSCNNDGAGNATLLNFDIDGTSQMGSNGESIEEAIVSEYLSCSLAVMSAPLSAGSHTFKFRWAVVTGGTSNMQCSASSSCNFWVQEVQD